MNKNKFEQITSLSFHGLNNLKVLKLKRNQIKYLMDGAFFGLESIEELHLDRNRVDTVSKGAFPKCNNNSLKRAIIVNNVQFASIICTTIRSLVVQHRRAFFIVAKSFNKINGGFLHFTLSYVLKYN